MFQSLVEKMSNAFSKFRNKGKLTEADVKAGMREIKLALLEADVNFKVVKDYFAEIKCLLVSGALYGHINFSVLAYVVNITFNTIAGA